MKTGSWVLDASALLAYLKREEGYKTVRSAMSSAAEGGVKVLINEINLGEVFYIISRQRSPEAATSFFHEGLPLLPVEPVPNTMADVVVAAKLKARLDLHYTDAFAVMTAMKHDATLLATDKDFKKAGKEIKIRRLR